MSPIESVPSPAALKVRSVLRRCAAAVALIALGAIASQYLAGYLFLWVSHVDPRRATPLTILRYGVYYHRIPVVRRRAMVCSGAGLGLVTALGVFLVIPSRGPFTGMPDLRGRPRLHGRGS